MLRNLRSEPWFYANTINQLDNYLNFMMLTAIKSTKYVRGTTALAIKRDYAVKMGYPNTSNMRNYRAHKPLMEGDQKDLDNIESSVNLSKGHPLVFDDKNEKVSGKVEVIGNKSKGTFNPQNPKDKLKLEDGTYLHPFKTPLQVDSNLIQNSKTIYPTGSSEERELLNKVKNYNND